MIDFSLQTVYNKSKRGDFMSQSMINFRMDSDLKKRMEETCKKMGLTMTAAFTMFEQRLQMNSVFHLKLRQILFTVRPIWKNLKKEFMILKREKLR